MKSRVFCPVQCPNHCQYHLHQPVRRVSVLADSVDIESCDRRRREDQGMRACLLHHGRDWAAVAAPPEQTGDLTLPQMTCNGLVGVWLAVAEGLGRSACPCQDSG